jgi:hypothetical protein
VSVASPSVEVSLASGVEIEILVAALQWTWSEAVYNYPTTTMGCVLHRVYFWPRVNGLA